MKRLSLLLVLVALVFVPALPAADPVIKPEAEKKGDVPKTATEAKDKLILHTRARVETEKGSGQYAMVAKTVEWEPKKTALVICDMWNEHWCQGATRRVAEMAPRMNEVLTAARARGVLIIHCPSSCLDAYKDTPMRKLAQAAPKVMTKYPLKNWCALAADHEAALPIDDSDGGCDCSPHCKQGSPWKREIATLEMKEGDAVTDSAEAYYLMHEREIENVIVMGVHTNMCVLGRPFSIRQMCYQGQNVLLMRDLTDTMYNSQKAPQVPHCQGTDLVVEHIEKYWCPSIESTDFTGKAPFHFAEDKRPHVAFLIGEDEYDTKTTLPRFAREELEPRGLRCSFIFSDEKDPPNFPGIETISTADLLFVSVRRRPPSTAQLDVVKKFVASGKPVIGIRTASHAFALRDNMAPPAGHAAWPEFDAEVLGGAYGNHYGAPKPGQIGATVRVVKKETAHKVLAGISHEPFTTFGSLYKNTPLALTATALLTGTEPGGETQPVAWTNTAKTGNRVFYTSLGHPKDFELPQFRQLLINGIYWSLDQPVPARNKEAGPMTAAANDGAAKPPADAKGSEPAKPPAEKTPAEKAKANLPVKPTVTAPPLTPAESLAKLKVPDDFVLEQVLAEPDIAQPVQMSFDERGRLWVVEYRQYPMPAGLKVVSHDVYWRAVYDKVPEPPPHGVKGRDRISIHEDTNGDGTFDMHTVFVDGLNIATACCKGRGGVWVLNPPYLLFYADKNNDDVPDGDPVVHLAGFGLEDTHSCVNSLQFGPDGWLYACQGSTVTGNVIRPGLDKTPVHTLGQLIWRYHPEKKIYEVFAEGGGNAFGLEIDSQGRAFSGHNGGDTRGFHYVQGGYSQKGFNKHGPLSNPYAFGFFPAMANAEKVQRFTHTFIVYEGGAMPEKYNGLMFGCEPLQGRIVMCERIPDGSTFKTRDAGYAVTSDDPWFRPVDIKVGPDGAIYIADWYDKQITHLKSAIGEFENERGRIYRLRAKDGKPVQPFDLAKLSSAELVEKLNHPNKWFRREALVVLGDRKDAAVVPKLRELLAKEQGQTGLEALWALNLCAGFDDAATVSAFTHPNPFVRAWAVRLACDDGDISPAVNKALRKLTAQESNVEVLSQLACSARRLPEVEGVSLAADLCASEVAPKDPHIPLLIWWAIEARCEKHADIVAAIVPEVVTTKNVLHQMITLNLMRRFAQAGTRKDLTMCAFLLDTCSDKDTIALLLKGFKEGLQGRALGNAPEILLTTLKKVGDNSLPLRVRLGEAEAVAEAIKDLSKGDLELVRLFGEVKAPACVPALLQVASTAKDEKVRAAALASLGQYDDRQIAPRLVEIYAQLPEVLRPQAVSVLASRAASSSVLLDAVAAGKIEKKDVPVATVRLLLAQGNAANAKRVTELWGDAVASAAGAIEKERTRLTGVLGGGSGDPYHGKELFTKSCGKCHQLYGQGGEVGPDLTSYQRENVERMLMSVVNPSAEIREGFETFLVQTSDGRTLTGFLADQDNQVVSLRTAEGQTITVPRDDMETFRATGQSLMPEGLLKELTDADVRDLFAYLRASQPLAN